VEIFCSSSSPVFRAFAAPAGFNFKLKPRASSSPSHQADLSLQKRALIFVPPAFFYTTTAAPVPPPQNVVKRMVHY
jgi:hypothetical protein